MQIKTNIINIVLLLLLGHCTNAQVSLTNTGTLFISNSTDTLFINGSFTNNSSSSLTNNGNLQVKQTLTNDQASMPAGTGVLVLNGSSTQIVDGTQIFHTNNLITNNAAGITLNNSLSIAGTHTFSSGLIGTSATPTYLIYEAGASYAGSDDSRHVTGWVKKNGSTDFIFPVGNATYLRPAAISSLSGNSEFNAHYYAPSQNIFNLLSPVVQVKANEYWQLDKVTGGTALVTLNWDHAKVAMDNVLLKDILAGVYNGSVWTDAGGENTATGSVTGTGVVTSNPVIVFGAFTIAYKTFPVPLRMVSFTAERRSGNSILHWITENEESVSNFDIQRSYDAINFSTIDTVRARNTSSQQHYYYTDHSLLRGFAWYRIRTVDIDGRFNYSKIAVVSETDASSDSFIVMNPVRTTLTVLNKTGMNNDVGYRLFSTAGQLLLRGNINMASNAAAAIQLPAAIVSGIYILELSNEKTQFRQKIVVDR